MKIEMKHPSTAFASSIAAVVSFAPEVTARCPLGFTGSAGSNYCVPEKQNDRKIWLEYSNEQSLLGLTDVSPCISEQQRIKLIDNYIMYCRKSKLPHLYN